VNATSPIRPAPYHAERTVRFLAWRDNRPVNAPALQDALTFDQAIAACLPAPHKARIAVLRIDDGRAEQHLHIYAVKQESKATWRRDPATGVPKAERRAYPELIFSAPVHSFQPVEPFDAFRDDAVGRDLSLVSQ
jgi:hypothetical protein